MPAEILRQGEERGPDGHRFAVVSGGNMVFSAPHEEPHTRDGERKFRERGTALLSMLLASDVGGSAIYTAGWQLGDPNWDDPHPYFTEAKMLADGGGCVVDLHIMRNRGVEVCLGLGVDHTWIKWMWEPLLEELLNADVRVSLNWPFGGRGRPITSRMQRAGVPSIQIEMIPEVFDAETRERVCVVSALRRAALRWRDHLDA